jgi:hypothetical protein
MAISKKGLRKIQVEGENFYWRVRKKISHDEYHNDQLGIPIQHESEGQLLIAYIGYCRSKDYGKESIESIPVVARLRLVLGIKSASGRNNTNIND